MSGRVAKQRRMAKRKIEVIETYLSGDRSVLPLLCNMGFTEVNESILKMKLARLSQKVLP
jgi:hypothetical protein